MDDQKRANIVARKAGYSRADEIIWVDDGADRVVHHTPFGYRKKTTDEYVPHAYRQNFGWKNTYYQNAYTIVALRKE